MAVLLRMYNVLRVVCAFHTTGPGDRLHERLVVALSFSPQVCRRRDKERMVFLFSDVLIYARPRSRLSSGARCANTQQHHTALDTLPLLCLLLQRVCVQMYAPSPHLLCRGLVARDSHGQQSQPHVQGRAVVS